MRALALGLALAAVALGGCLWTKFDDAVVNPPIEFLDRPTWVQGGYGTVLAGDPTQDALLVGGYPMLASAAVFGFSSNPFLLRPGCEDATLCRLVGSPVAAGSQAGGSNCFAYGVGGGHPDMGKELGLVGGCASGQLFKLPLPPSMRDRLTDGLFRAGSAASVFPGLLALASSGSVVAAGSPDAGLVAVFLKKDGPPVEIPAPADVDGSFGRVVALPGDEQQGLMLAVSAPGQGRVYFYDNLAKPVLKACVQRPAPFGAVLHGFADRGRRLLAISDAAGRVEILDAGKLPAAPGCAEPPAEAVVDQLRCIEDGDVGGCSDGAFGYSIATADLDGDGGNEVIVGAPGVNVRGVANTGALAIFPIDARSEVPRYLFLSSASPDDRVGTSVAAFKKDGRVVVASSALIKQKTPIFHCASTTPSGRCQ